MTKADPPPKRQSRQKSHLPLAVSIEAHAGAHMPSVGDAGERGEFPGSFRFVTDESNRNAYRLSTAERIDRLSQYLDATNASIISLQREIESYPHNANLHALLSQALLDLSQAGEERALLERGIELGVKAASEAVAESSQSADAHYELGRRLEEARDYAEAIKSYSVAIRLGLNNSDAYYSISNLLFLEKRYKEALDFALKSLSVGSDEPETRSLIAAIYCSTGRYDEALRSSERALELDPQHWPAYFYEGKSYFALGRVGEALDSYGKAIELGYWPKLKSVYWSYGEALLEHGDKSRAIEALRAAIQIDENDGESEYKLGRALIRCGAIDSGIDHLKEALTKGGTTSREPEIYYEIGLAFTASLNTDLAIGAFSNINEISAINHPRFLERGYSFIRAMKALHVVETLKYFVYKEEMGEIENIIRELANLTEVPEDFIRDCIDQFKISERRQQVLHDQLRTWHIAKKPGNPEDDQRGSSESRDASVVATGGKPEISPPSFKVPQALVTTPVAKRVKTRERVFTARALDEANTILNALRVRQARGDVLDLSDDDMGSIRSARNYVQAWRRAGKPEPS